MKLFSYIFSTVPL